jgi:hypothetical protein
MDMWVNYFMHKWKTQSLVEPLEVLVPVYTASDRLRDRTRSSLSNSFTDFLRLFALLMSFFQSPLRQRQVKRSQFQLTMAEIVTILKANIVITSTWVLQDISWNSSILLPLLLCPGVRSNKLKLISPLWLCCKLY